MTTSHAVRYLLVGWLIACGSGGVRPADDATEPPGPPPEAATTESSFVFGPEAIPDEVRCTADADCIATRFHDCCADNQGRCPCEWHAENRAYLEERQLECGIEECADGACPECPPSEPPGDARCLDGYCQLPADG